MKKDKQYFGIDISKDVFDVMSSNGTFYEFENNHKGFKAFLKLLNARSHCVMEATGYYHCRLYFQRRNDGIKNPHEGNGSREK